MADQDSEVVIIDASGTEHVFPAGFDPQKAAGIVREQTTPKTGDPNFTLPGGPGTAALAGAKGFAKEAVPAVGKAIAGLPTAVVDLIQEAGKTVGGTANLLDDPVATLKDAYDSMKGIPSAASEKIKAALDLARRDPEAFGRAVADVTAQAEVAVVGSKLAPLAPRTFGANVGKLMETVGTKGQWPMRMMGAHQLGTGNPMGIATMAAPEMLKSGGRSLRLMAGEEGATAASMPTRFLKLQNDLASGAVSPEETLSQLNTMQKDLGDRLSKAKLPEQVKDLQAEQTRLNSLAQQAKQTVSKTTATTAPLSDQEAVAAYLKKAQAGAPGTRIMPTIAPPEGAGLGGVRASLPTPKGGAPITVAPNPMGGAPIVPPVSGGGLENPRVPPFNRDTMETLTGSRTGGLENLTPGETPAGAASDMEEAIHNAPRTYGRTEPTEPLGPENKPASIEEAVLQRETKIPVEGNVPASKSKRGPMSATPGLTVEDAKSLGLNPNNRIVGLTPDAIEKLLLERAQRSGAYRTDAGLNTGANKAVALDEP